MNYLQMKKERTAGNTPQWSNAIEYAICVEPGPGNEAEIANNSANDASVSHWCFVTNALWRIAMCAFGPPKVVNASGMYALNTSLHRKVKDVILIQT